MAYNEKNGHKMAISSKLDFRIAEMAIINWIPCSKGATVQKGTKMETYASHNDQKTGPNRPKFTNMANKWPFFP